MIGRIILILLATALGLLLILGLLVAVNVLRVGPNGIEIAHENGNATLAGGDDGNAPHEDLWMKAYHERQEREKSAAPDTSAPPAAQPPAPAQPTAPIAIAPPTATPGIRIRAGSARGLKDAEGNDWEPDNGFDGGQIVDRGNIGISNTRTPDIYRCEHYSMTGFHHAVPNGDYLVKLHFAETWQGIDAPGRRVFGVSVQGNSLGNIDVFGETGSQRRALIKTARAHVTDGMIRIEFHKTEKDAPEINGIEILPAGR